MNLHEYARPKNDTGLGICYFPDFDHYDTASTERWIPELKALGVSWLNLWSPLARPVPEAFIKTLREHEIEPVVRIYTGPIQPIDRDALYDLARTYAGWDVHYAYVYNEPNLPAEWADSRMDPREWVQVFVDLLMPCLDTLRAGGLTPVLPPLSQSGGKGTGDRMDGWRDLDFLSEMLDLIGRRSDRVFDELALGIHNVASNRPLDWGAGGRARWGEAQAAGEDSTDFHSFEWYDEIVRERVGYRLPMISAESGVLPGDHTDPDRPAVDLARHAEIDTEIAQQMMSGQLPDYLLNISFWLLGAGATNLEPHAWYKSDGTELPVVAALRTMTRQCRAPHRESALGERNVSVPAAAAAAQSQPPADETLPRASELAACVQTPVNLFSPEEIERALGVLKPNAGKAHSLLQENGDKESTPDTRPLYHYLLLPVFEWGISEWYWQLTLNYIKRFRPVCGFDAGEARHAEYVTIIGDTRGVDRPTEAELKAVGCHVERIAGPDAESTRLLLDEMAHSGRRFRTWEVSR